QQPGMRTERTWILVVVALGVAVLVPSGARVWRAVCLLRALAARGDAPAEVRTEEVTIAAGGRAVRARIYFRAEGSSRRGLVVAHGVHYQGIDGRLVPFAREL